MKTKARRNARDSAQIVGRVRRDDLDRAREWLKSRNDPTLSDDEIDHLGVLVLFRRLVKFVRRDA